MSEPHSRFARRYDREFKQNAVALVLKGRSQSEVSRDLGVSAWSLGEWVKKAKAGQALHHPKTLDTESPQRDERAAKLHEFLASFTLLDFDDAASRAYGEIRATLEKQRKIIGPLDLLTAAHARSIGATVLTGNYDEFKRVPGLKVLRWK